METKLNCIENAGRTGVVQGRELFRRRLPKVFYLNIAVVFCVLGGYISPCIGEVTVADGLQYPGLLHLDSGTLYFATSLAAGNDSIQAVSVNGGSVSLIVSGASLLDAGATRGISDFALSPTSIYGGFGGYQHYAIFSAPLSGGTISTLASPTGGTFLGKNGSDLYFSSTFNEIRKLPVAGGSSIATATGMWVRSYVLDDTGVYFRSYQRPAIEKFDFNTHATTTIATGLPLDDTPLFADRKNLYFQLPAGGISAVSKSGGTSTPIISKNGAVGYAAANGNIFYSDGTKIQQSSIAGGAPLTLATVVSGTILSMATDGNWLYYSFSDRNNGQIKKVPVGIIATHASEEPSKTLTQIARPSSTKLLVLSRNGMLDKTRPTIVLTHGFAGRVNGEWPTQLSNRILESDPQVNVVAWDWSDEAGSVAQPWTLSDATSRTPNQGAGLGKALSEALGANYQNTVRFVGHSLGTLVNAEAVNVLHRNIPGAPIIDTLFDDAEIANLASNLAKYVSLQGPAWAPSIPSPGSATAIDNYISAVGNLHPEAANVILTQGPTALHPFEFHGYPQQWFLDTVGSTKESLMGLGFQFSPERASPNSVFLQSNPLDPNDLVAISPEAGTAVLIARNGIELATIKPDLVSLLTTATINGIVNSTGDVVTSILTVPSTESLYETTPRFVLSKQSAAVNHSADRGTKVTSKSVRSLGAEELPADLSLSSYAWVPITIPLDADTMSFNFTFNGLDADDFLSVGIDDVRLLAIEGTFISDGLVNSSGFLDISQWSGQDVNLFLGLISANLNLGGEIILDSFQFQQIPEPTLPWSTLVGVYAMRMRVRKLFPRKAKPVVSTSPFAIH